MGWTLRVATVKPCRMGCVWLSAGACTPAQLSRRALAHCWIQLLHLDASSTPAAVRSADIIIGSHGATMANAFFARPGTASEQRSAQSSCDCCAVLRTTAHMFAPLSAASPGHAVASCRVALALWCAQPGWLHG